MELPEGNNFKGRIKKIKNEMVKLIILKEEVWKIRSDLEFDKRILIIKK